MEDDGSPKKKQNPINALAETIASMFTPILPALVGCGMIQCVLNIASALGLDSSSGTYTILNMMGQLIFYFLPFMLAVTAAEKFKTNRALAMLLAGGYIYFTVNFADVSLDFLGIPLRTVTYTSTVIPIILSVFVLKYVYDIVNRIIPEMLRVVLVPMVTLFIMIPLELALLGPIGAYIGSYLANAIAWLFSVSGLIAGALLGFFRPILVMFGMHYSIMPIQVQQVAETGMTAMLCSAICANIAQSAPPSALPSAPAARPCAPPPCRPVSLHSSASLSPPSTVSPCGTKSPSSAPALLLPSPPVSWAC